MRSQCGRGHITPLTSCSRQKLPVDSFVTRQIAVRLGEQTMGSDIGRAASNGEIAPPSGPKSSTGPAVFPVRHRADEHRGTVRAIALGRVRECGSATACLARVGAAAHGRWHRAATHRRRSVAPGRDAGAVTREAGRDTTRHEPTRCARATHRDRARRLSRHFRKARMDPISEDNDRNPLRAGSFVHRVGGMMSP